ncbi:MAG: ABC transporter ATP-binding protein, partial [Erysipelotrichaceae bacterium]
KVDEKTYKELDKEYILKTMNEGFGYTLLTNEKQYYQENYKDIVIENAMIDNIILMMVKGK